MNADFPNYDGAAGAAFLLRNPPRESATLAHADGIVTIRERAPYISVTLPACPLTSTVQAQAWKIVQESLDIRAATWHEALATCRGDTRYLTWTRTKNGFCLCITDTAESSWSSTPKLPIDSTQPTPARTAHHHSFRFYRLSRLTDDLFDAYRNAYLALECLISEVSPIRGGESELDWLKRVLRDDLSGGIPGGMNVDAVANDLYKQGRLPLFHAKLNRRFYAPQGEDRNSVQRLYPTLCQLLASLYRHRFGDSFPGFASSISRAAIDGRTRVSFQIDEVLYKFNQEEDLQKPYVELVEDPRKFGNIWARIDASPPSTMAFIDSVELRNGGRNWLTLELAEPVPMTQITTVSLEVFALDYNVHEPKSVYLI